MMNVQHKFYKSHRLLSAKQFKYVFDKPTLKSHSSHLMLFTRKNDLSYPRLGLAITKKKVPTAVARNRLKRKTREYFRCHQHLIKNYDVILIVKQPITLLTKKDIDNQLNQLFKKIK